MIVQLFQFIQHFFRVSWLITSIFCSQYFLFKAVSWSKSDPDFNMCLASFIGELSGEINQKEKLLQSSWIKEWLMFLRRCSRIAIQSYPQIQTLVYLFLTLLVILHIEYHSKNSERISWKLMETSWYRRYPLVTPFEVPMLLELFLHYEPVQINAWLLHFFNLNSDLIFLIFGSQRS